MSPASLFERSGKVRDLYTIDSERLLLVASDRLSAFDVVLPTPIPDKGRVLTGLSRFWFAETRSIVPNHLLGVDLAGIPSDAQPMADPAELRGRLMICRRAGVLPFECIVRGFLAGSGWKAYRETGVLCGIALPAGCTRLSEKHVMINPAERVLIIGKQRGGKTRFGKPLREAVPKHRRDGWLPPSLEARVRQTINLVRKLMRLAPISERRSGDSPSNREMPSAIDAGVGFTHTISGHVLAKSFKPGTRDSTVGTPAPIASAAAQPKPSKLEGIRNISEE